MKGLILGVHHNSPSDYFVVLRIVRGNEYPPINISRELNEHKRLTSSSTSEGKSVPAYTRVWFQPLDESLIPESVS